MKPADVSTGLVEVAELALATKCIEARDAGERCDCPTDDQIRIIIAAVLGHLLDPEVP